MSSHETIKALLLPPERWIIERAAYVAHHAPDPFELTRELEKIGVRLELVDPAPWAANTLGRRHPFYSGFDPIRAIKAFSRRGEIDLIVSVFESSGAIPLLLRELLGGGPTIAMWDLIPDEDWAPRHMIQKYTLPRFDEIFLLSNQQNCYLEERYGRKGIFVGQHIDTNFYQPHMESESNRVIAVGDDRGRDFATLIAATADLNIDIIFKTKQKLDFPAGSRARFIQISERLTPVAFRELIASAAIIAVPLHATQNVSGVGTLLEAGALAKPIVVSDNPPVRDYFVESETAISVPVHDSVSMRDAITELLDNKILRRRLGNSARAFVETKYARPAFAATLAHAIRKSISLKK